MYPSNFYHFTAQHLPGIYAALVMMGQEGERSLPIFYDGPFHRLVTPFSKLPVCPVGDAPSNTIYVAPQLGNQYLMPVAQVLSDSVLSQPRERYILVIQRERNRVIQNIDLLVDALTCLAPVKVCTFDQMSFEEQVCCIRSARAVICAHGAALTHMMFANQATPFVEIRPFGFSWSGYRRLADLFGHSLLSLESKPTQQERDALVIGLKHRQKEFESPTRLRDLVRINKHVRRLVRNVPRVRADVGSILQWLSETFCSS
jgi:hypothetical protein